MEGSAEDLGASDSWEVADLGEGMSRLMVSSQKSPTPDLSGKLPLQALDSFACSTSASAATTSGKLGSGLKEDVINQVDQFLREALDKPRERLSILRMEQDVQKFICDPTQKQLEFHSLPTSYLRLAAHRVALHYSLQSVAVPDNILPGGSGSRIVLHKTSEHRFPPIRLADIPVNLRQEDSNSEVKVAIKERPQKCAQTIDSLNTHASKTNHPRSVEERKDDYNRARARIFSTIGGGSSGVKSESEPAFPDDLQQCLVSARMEEKSAVEGPEISLSSGSGDFSTCNSRSGRGRIDKDPVVNRYKTSNRVAIFRDREVDRKDPDYDRSYVRYMQRFDPGLGFNGGPYTIQPMYSPALNYNTEFPQLGLGHRSQISIEHQPRPVSQHMHGPWPATSIPSALSYGPLEGMMVPFIPNHIGAHSSSSIHLHSSQYVASPRSGMTYLHPLEHVQHFAQTQQQREASFGLARPR